MCQSAHAYHDSVISLSVLGISILAMLNAVMIFQWGTHMAAL